MKTFLLNESTVPLAAAEGENGTAAIAVRCEAWARDFPAGSGALLFYRPDGEIYPLTAERRGACLTAVLTGAETAVPGLCLVQAQWRAGGDAGTVIAKAGPFRFRVAPVPGGQALPAPVPSWAEQVLAKADEAAEAARAAQNAADSVATATVAEMMEYLEVYREEGE